MKTVVYVGIAIRLILLFSIGMVMTYVRPLLRPFFGDVYVGKKQYTDFGINDGYDWGAAHYWFFWMCVFLFILSLINCIMSIYNLLNKHYKL